MKLVPVGLLIAALMGLSCGGPYASPVAPSATVPTVPSPTSPAPSPIPSTPVPTPSPSPTPNPALQSAIVSGTVRDGQGDSLLAQVAVAVMDGGDTGRSATTDAFGVYSLGALQQGTFTIRFSRSGFTNADRTVALNRDTTLNVTLPRTCATPSVPANFASNVSGGNVIYSWSSVTGATDYIVDAGTSPGATGSLSVTASGTTYTWNSVAPGTYYARVKARNACATSIPSDERTVTVSGSAPGGGGGTLPSSWPGSLPSRTSGSHPVCQATLPSNAQCVNNLIGPPQAICSDSVYSCSTGSGTCSSHGGVYCWRN
jgi:hypothetical protein